MYKLIAIPLSAAVVLGAFTPPFAVESADTPFNPAGAAMDSGATVVNEEDTSVLVEYATYVGGIDLPGVLTDAEVDLPDFTGHSDIKAGEPLLSTDVSGSTISTYATDAGTQTFIEIPGAGSPTEYTFHLDVPDGASVAVERDGSIAIRDELGGLLSGYETPWAFDANGDPVPTHFRVDGHDLIQVIELSATDAYPVIADPSDLWGWTVCIGVVLAEVAGNAAIASKFAKLVTRFGSIRKTVEIMVRAWRTTTNVAKRRDAVIKAVGALAGEIIGVNAIKDACFS